MRDRLVHFENRGQSFEAWAIDENDVIREVIPHDEHKIVGSQIEWPQPLSEGMKPVISPVNGGRLRQCHTPIFKIEKI